MSPSKKEIRRHLLDLGDQLSSNSSGSSDDRAAVELDQTRVGRLSRMDALQMQAMSSALKTRRRQALKRIEAALKRLDDGEYGYCLECGDEIAPGRLKSDPAAPLCATCAR
jgi:DnaK suppressor protein